MHHFEMLLYMFDCFNFCSWVSNDEPLANFFLLPCKSCTSWFILGTYDHWAVSVFIVPHFLWHGTSIYNGHGCRGWDDHPSSSGTNVSNQLHHRRGKCYCKVTTNYCSSIMYMYMYIANNLYWIKFFTKVFESRFKKTLPTQGFKSCIIFPEIII